MYTPDVTWLFFPQMKHNTWLFALSCKHTASFFTSQSAVPEGLHASLLVTCSHFRTSKDSNLWLCYRWDFEQHFALQYVDNMREFLLTYCVVKVIKLDFPLSVQRSFWCVIFVLGVLSVMIGGFVTICATAGTSHRLYEAGGALFITGGETFIF